MKTCTRCGKEKPLSEFYKTANTHDGYYGQCKSCRKEYQAQYDLKNRIRILEYQTQYYLHNRERILNRLTRYFKQHPERKIAKGALNYAIKTGRLLRQPCIICGSTENIDGHHKDYLKPLDVVWLCRRHHCLESNRIARSKEIEVVQISGR